LDDKKCGVTSSATAGNTAASCDYKNGPLPDCAPLAAAFVPVQQKCAPQYKKNEALSRGTLFPGLDLPFMNINGRVSSFSTPSEELAVLSFVLDELGLYLDTHKDDAEAFAAYKEYTALYNEGKKRYVQLYGPITQRDTAAGNAYTWLRDPWPWEPTAAEV